MPSHVLVFRNVEASAIKLHQLHLVVVLALPLIGLASYLPCSMDWGSQLWFMSGVECISERFHMEKWMRIVLLPLTPFIIIFIGFYLAASFLPKLHKSSYTSHLHLLLYIILYIIIIHIIGFSLHCLSVLLIAEDQTDILPLPVIHNTQHFFCG